MGDLVDDVLGGVHRAAEHDDPSHICTALKALKDDFSSSEYKNPEDYFANKGLGPASADVIMYRKIDKHEYLAVNLSNARIDKNKARSLVDRIGAVSVQYPEEVYLTDSERLIVGISVD